jgi:hypothetical protein
VRPRADLGVGASAATQTLTKPAPPRINPPTTESVVDRRAVWVGFVGEGVAVRQIPLAYRRLRFHRGRRLVVAPYANNFAAAESCATRADHTLMESSERRELNSCQSSICCARANLTTQVEPLQI